MNIDYHVFYNTLPGLAILVGIECIEMIKEQRFAKGKKDLFASVYIGVGAITISAVTKALVLMVFAWMYQFRFFTLPQNAWWAWVLCFFADDFSYYWFHRCCHQVRFFWASHAVHHSAESFTFSMALRLPWTSNITGTFLFWAWMPLIGLSPAMTILMKSLSAVYQFWLHTEKIKKLPKWFEFVFNTPSNHRVHHGSNADYLDKNHGGTLMLCDHLFGTFLQESHPPVYGLTKNVGSSNPFVILFHEWANLLRDLKKARRPVDYLRFVFGAPGWSNDSACKRAHPVQGVVNEDGTAKVQYKQTACNNNCSTCGLKGQHLAALPVPGRDSHVSKTGLKMVLLIAAVLTSSLLIAQTTHLNYNVMQDNNKIGAMSIERKDSANTTLIKLHCEIRKRVIFMFTIIENQEAFFANGVMQRSYLFRKVNSNIKVDQTTNLIDSYYAVTKRNSTKQVISTGIRFTQASMYFTEPVGINQAYSDNYADVINIDNVSEGCYKVTLPDGNINFYYYKNGVCSKVHVERSMFTVDLELAK